MSDNEVRELILDNGRSILYAVRVRSSTIIDDWKDCLLKQELIPRVSFTFEKEKELEEK